MRDDYFNNLDNYLHHVKKRQRQWQWFLNLATFAVVAWMTFSFINYPAIQARAVYAFSGDTQPSKKVVLSSSDTVIENTDEAVSSLDEEVADEAAEAKPTYQIVSDLPDGVPEDGVYIEKIDVKAPITWNGNSDNVQDLLADGVVHIAGSASPGTPGNVFITGHSSDVWWTDGNYKTVFSLLDKVENNDEIIIRYRGNNFAYKVYNKEVIDKDNVKDFIETDKGQSLTIMTCYPIGTNWRRLMVQAERV